MLYPAFVRSNARPLAFGALHAFYSTPGQTFCIGLFVAAFASDLSISPSAISALYLAGTLSAAGTLLFVGHLIERVRLVHFSAAVIVGLAIACFATASAVGPASLFLGLYLLRLTGQSLMTHVEATATARAFDRERGRALGITALGIPLAEIVFPPLVVGGIGLIGWRPTYAMIGAVALVVLLPLTQWLLRGIARSPRPTVIRSSALSQLRAGLSVLVRSRYVWAILPAAGLMPFCGTAIMFHITTIAGDRGWPLGLIAASFPVAAIANVAGLFVSGQIIDRRSARKMFLVQALPFLAGMGILAAFVEPWALPVAFACHGFSSGLSKTTLTAVWAELFGTQVLGTIRSAVAMYMVIASALAPFVFGAALDAGWTVSGVLAMFVAVGIVVLLPPVFAERRSFM
ncbi:arsenite efflux MFS transporter ArsK [soil metagenome]